MSHSSDSKWDDFSEKKGGALKIEEGGNRGDCWENAQLLRAKSSV